MSADNLKYDPVLERAMEEIREDVVDEAVVQAAAVRVWAKLNGAAQPHAVHC